MKTEEIALSRLVENEDNPRTITNSQFQKLVQSIIVFPKMLYLRPIVVDEKMSALGGNMRLRALRHLTTMDETGIRLKLNAEGRLTEEQQNAIIEYWKEWQKQPTVPVVYADDLSEAQKDEFVAKDNISYGSWDYSELANNWDAGQLQGWGLAVWNDVQPEFKANQESETKKPQGSNTGAYDNDTTGIDIDISSTPKEKRTGQIIINFKREEQQAVADFLGLGELDRVVYNFEDLPKQQKGGEE